MTVVRTHLAIPRAPVARPHQLSLSSPRDRLLRMMSVPMSLPDQMSPWNRKCRMYQTTRTRLSVRKIPLNRTSSSSPPILWNLLSPYSPVGCPQRL